MMRQLWMRQREGVISLAVLVAIILLALLLALDPVFSQIERYRAELAKDARTLQQLRAIDGARDELESTFTEYEEKDLQSWVYSKQRADAVALDIQRRVSAELANASAQVSSVSPLAVKTQDGYSVVGVQVNFSASMVALMQVLQMLEQDKPLLVFESVRISPARARRSVSGDFSEQSVDVQMTVLTYLVAENASEVVQ